MPFYLTNLLLGLKATRIGSILTIPVAVMSSTPGQHLIYPIVWGIVIFLLGAVLIDTISKMYDKGGIKSMLRNNKDNDKDKDMLRNSTDNDKGMLRNSAHKVKSMLLNATAVGVIGLALSGVFFYKYEPVLWKEDVASVNDGLHVARDSINDGLHVTQDARGAVTSTHIPKTYKVGAYVDIKKFKIDQSGYIFNNQNYYATPSSPWYQAFSVQENLYLEATEKDGKREYFWLQDAVTTTYHSKVGGLEYHYVSEIFKVSKPNSHEYEERIESDEMKGKGSIYRDPSTYIYWSPHWECLRYPFRVSLAIETKVVNGQAEIYFEYSKSNWKQDLDNEAKWKTFDTVTLGKNGEFKAAYIYADSYYSAGSIGIGGRKNRERVYLKNLEASFGIFGYWGGDPKEVKYSQGFISTAEQTINAMFKGGGLPPDGRVVLVAEHNK